MSDFDQRFQEYLDQQEEQHKDEFRIQRNAFQSGYEFPMRVSYRNDDPSFFWGIKDLGRTDRLCSEYCYYASCQGMTVPQLEAYFQAGNKIRHALAEPTERGHTYTLIDLVLCTDAIPSDLRKKLRRHSDVIHYKDEAGTGWSEVRVCVVDLSTGEIVTNKDGGPLKNRLTGNLEEKRTSFFDKLFGRKK